MDAATNTWSCGYAGAGCVATMTPTRAPTGGAFSCNTSNVDINTPATGGVGAAAPTCCAN